MWKTAFKKNEGYLPQILLGPFLNTLTQMPDFFVSLLPCSNGNHANPPTHFRPISEKLGNMSVAGILKSLF